MMDSNDLDLKQLAELRKTLTKTRDDLDETLYGEDNQQREVVRGVVPELALKKIALSELETLATSGINQRKTLLRFLKSVLEALESDRDSIRFLMSSAHQTAGLSSEKSGIDFNSAAGYMLLTKLLDNAARVTKDIVYMARLISELSLQWENFDKIEDDPDKEADELLAEAEDTRAEGLDLVR